MTEYPARTSFFAAHYIRWLSQSGLAVEIGASAFALLTVIVLTEDELRYQRAPNFYNDQLGRLCGIVSEPSLIRARKQAIDAGLLYYQQGAKRRPGVYFVLGFPNDSLAKPTDSPNDSFAEAKGTVGECAALLSYPNNCPNSSRLGDHPGRVDSKNSRPNAFTQADLETANWMWSVIQEMQPDRKPPNLGQWANDIHMMRECDGRTDPDIRTVFAKANSDRFWQSIIVSPGKLREKFDDLKLKLGLNRKSKNSGEDIRTVSQIRKDRANG